jgi:hypothetical protein
VIKKPGERGGHSPRWAAVPEEIIIIIACIKDIHNNNLIVMCKAIIFNVCGVIRKFLAEQ